MREFCRECKMEGDGIVISKAICNTYNERLKNIIRGDNKDFTAIDLGCPSEALLESGLPLLPIQTSVKTLTTKAAQQNHPFKLVDIVHLPDYIREPIAIFRSATSVDDCKVVLTEMESDGVNIVVIVKPYVNYKGFLVNDIRTLFPRDNIKPILEWISINNLMEYCNKQKILKWLSKHQYNPDEVTKLLKDCTKIIEKISQ